MKNKKIKIHVKNNHWAPGSFPSDEEGEKVFTITNAHFEKAFEKFPQIKEKVEIFIDWDEDNFNSSMSNSDILLAWNFTTSNLKKVSPNLKWIHCISAGINHLIPLDWMSEGLVLTNNSGVHSKKAGEYGLMSVLMIQNHLPKIITNQKSKGDIIKTNGQDTVLRVPKRNIDDRNFIKSIGSAVMKLQFDAGKMSIKDRDNYIISKLSSMEENGAF